MPLDNTGVADSFAPAVRTESRPRSSMLNYPETIRSTPHFRKFEIGDLLFAKYTCPLKQTEVGLWAPTDYLIHVLSGRKTWHTIDGEWTAVPGQTLFFKKGASIVHQYFDAEFCQLVFFIPDAFVRGVVTELAGQVAPPAASNRAGASALRVNNDTALGAFFRSMLEYFSGEREPPGPLLRLKLQELIVSILTGPGNPDLAAYLASLPQGSGPSIGEIMEANFRFNLSLPEYAALCHRSVSSFKRDFQRHFGDSPGKWLLRRRLDYARALLGQPGRTVTEVVFESGFEDVSHFSRVFKVRFGAPPSAFRTAPA